MNIFKNKFILVICIIILSVGTVFAVVRIVQHTSYQREQRLIAEAEREAEEVKKAEQRKIAETYVRLHYAFWMRGGGYGRLWYRRGS